MTKRIFCHVKSMLVATSFVTAKLCLLWQNLCHDKYLSQQTRVCCNKSVFCLNKHTFVTTQNIFCRDKHVCCDKSMRVTKILVAAPANDTLQEQVSQQNIVVVVLIETASARYSVRLVYTGPCRHPVNMLDPARIWSSLAQKVLVKSRQDSCTLACFWTGSVWPKPDAISQNSDLDHLWKNSTESERGKLVMGQLHSARIGSDDSCFKFLSQHRVNLALPARKELKMAAICSGKAIRASPWADI